MGKNESHHRYPAVATVYGHFWRDHDDDSYFALYFNDPIEIGVTVEITQHVGSESDRWLPHEIDIGFRNRVGTPSLSYSPRIIDGQLLLENSIGGADYRWISGNKVIIIRYHDLEMKQPEPLEVVRAYLAKHPSTMPLTTLAQLRNTVNVTTWIKDEMTRLLWLCDKLFIQLQQSKTDNNNELFYELAKSMKTFIAYREKYYGIKTSDKKTFDENVLLSQCEAQKDTKALKSKLDEYKTWWESNKDKHIHLLTHQSQN